VRISEAERTDYLDKLAERIKNLFVEEPYSLPLMADFQNFANDARQRFVVVIKHSKPVDDNYKKLIPKEQECVRQLTKEGFLLDLEMSSLADPNWTAFMRVRASNEDEVRNHLKRLPLLAYLSFEITRVEPLAPAPTVLASN
jgi:muconolactone delta-isomerase